MVGGKEETGRVAVGVDMGRLLNEKLSYKEVGARRRTYRHFISSGVTEMKAMVCQIFCSMLRYLFNNVSDVEHLKDSQVLFVYMYFKSSGVSSSN